MTQGQADTLAPVSRDLEGQAAFVTGGATGIGLAVSRALAARGAAVAIFARNQARAEEAAAAIRAAGAKAQAHVADIQDTASVDAAFAQALEQLGRVDILVNNAGLQHVSPITEFPEDRFEHLIRVMLLGAFHLTKAVLPGMIERRWGRIVNIGSIHSLVASANKSAYVAAKHGLLGLTRTVALEVGEHGVTVNLVAPTYVRSALVEGQIADQARTLGIPAEQVVEQTMLAPMAVKRLLEPADVAAYVRFLCTEAARSITGTTQVIDGGWTAR